MFINQPLPFLWRVGFIGIAATLLIGVQLFSQQVVLRENEVFYRAGETANWLRLTSDGSRKSNLRVSPDLSRFAFLLHLEAPKAWNDILRIIDTSGKTIQDFDPRTSIPGEGCPSLVDHQWLGTGAMLLVCHKNPSLSEAYKLDLAAGRVTERLRGYAFSASPDGTRIANVGFIVHFAPRWAKSEFLEINGTHVFPKGNSVRDGDPHIVRELNGVYRDVHEFRQPFVWSPDSSRVAFTEKVFDCRSLAQALDEQCEEESIRFQLVVCETSGTCYTAPLFAGEFGLEVSWLDPVSLKVGSRMMQLSDLRSAGTH